MTWFLFAPLSLLASILTMILSPLLPLFAGQVWGAIDNGNDAAIEPRLPRWLRWFSTDDNSLLGDNGHKRRWAGKSQYWQMVAWLWRNPGYGFDIDVLGAKIGAAAPILIEGKIDIKNREGGREGKLKVTIGNYWCWKWIKQITTTRCLMLEFGWKLQGYAQHGAPTKAERAQIVCSARFTDFTPAEST